MRRQRNMIAAVLLLCAAGVYSDGRAAQSQDCVPTVEVACFLPAEYLNASRPVSVEVRAGKKLNISLEGLYEYSDCQWIRGTDVVKAMSFSDSIILPPLSGTDSGECTLSCEAGNGTRFSLSVALHVVMTRPTKPQLILTDTENDNKSPLFKCKSTGCPKPTLKWSGNVDGTNFGGNIETAESTIKTVDYINRGVMCCATNPEGQECSQLYDLDINTMENKVSSVTLTPGQSLLLRCRQRREPFTFGSLMWEKGTTSIDPKTSGCLSKNKEEICMKKDGHSGSQMAYLLIESVNVNHTGIYTCRNQVNKTKSVKIYVQAEDFLSVKLDDSIIVQASTSCLQANVSYQPILQRCTWEDPDKIMTKCIRDEWVTMHRTVKLCNHLKSGEYKLHLEAGGQKETKTVSVCVIARPTKPQLILTDTENEKKSPLFKCKSTGCPKPTLKWSGNVDGKNFGGNIETAESTITSVDYINRGVMCCATNPEGQECSQLYDLDINTMENEVSNVTLTPGQSLLLRCRQRCEPFTTSSLMWEKGTTSIDPKTSGCLSKNKEEICIQNDKHSGSQMAYLLIESVNVNHTGIYTCRNQVKQTKSVNISVQAKDFLSVKLDDRRIVQASNSCLQANVSYQPILQRCIWEDPDKIRTKCTREEWVTMHRNVTLCNHLKSGEYKLHLEAGGQKETKTVSVCVIDKPKFNFKTVDNNFTIETWSHVPANYSWMSCSTNVSCETDFDWKEVNGTAQTDSEVSCNKTIKSSVSRQKVDGEDQIKFCITTLVGSECKIFPVYKWPSPQQSIGSSPPVNDNSTVLRTACLGLLVALIGVSMVLTYFVKKKKPQYQPQLQMLQMVGPNDNDYIYINFKDFEYDSKWEFPRENLELGKALGSGAFGMVVQATAYGINKPGVSQQVAVKMLKDKHQTVEKEALMSELKMLTHIGHHANIVNLLGACTDTGPIYLIFQYCCHGDLLNYLKNNSKRYHKSVTDAFNKDRFRSLYHNLQPRKTSSEKQTVDNYVPMYSSTTRGQEDIALLTINSDMDSFEDPAIFENLDDQTEDLEALTFDDLLSFAYQVAKGMDFLCGKNCIHRDLAARNVLVTKGRMVKIGDFGLARDIDNDSNYVVRGNVRLPVKWMAPESIFQGMYTMKSDVWAYGILLWEIFSLGVTPYPDMKVDHVFYSMIEKGFKMECPYYANQSVYEIMYKCWALDACQRPSFSKIVSFMSSLLTDREEKLYHNMLNDYTCDYQNASFTLDISALTKQNENKTQSVNVYCKAHATEESKVEMCDSDTVEAEEEFLKTSGTE